MTDERLNDLAEKLLAAHRHHLEAQHAYYGRAAKEDPALEQAYIDASEAFDRAKFLHFQALTLWSPYNDPDSEYVRIAAEVMADEGLA